MAVKKMTGAKKPAPKTAPKPKPKAKVTTSRGSNTTKQVDDMNQREWYNAQREYKTKRSKRGNIIGGSGARDKVSQAWAELDGFDVEIERKRQRAGGGFTRTANKNSNQIEATRLTKSVKAKAKVKPTTKAKGKR
jgi:hypothetical protein